jgi:hypothetical protein
MDIQTNQIISSPLKLKSTCEKSPYKTKLPVDRKDENPFLPHMPFYHRHEPNKKILDFDENFNVITKITFQKPKLKNNPIVRQRKQLLSKRKI